MEILFLVSTLATVQGFHNAIARYYVLAVAGRLGAAGARPHAPVHDSPHIASFLQTGIAAVVVLGSTSRARIRTWRCSPG